MQSFYSVEYDVKTIMNGDQVRFWKEEIVADVTPSIQLERLKKTKTLSEGSNPTRIRTTNLSNTIWRVAALETSPEDLTCWDGPAVHFYSEDIWRMCR
jgi:hypothetical protein